MSTKSQARPEIDESARVADNATIIGSVSLGPESSVWYSAVLRADGESITIGARTNIQDGAVLHTDPSFPLLIGTGVSVGHGAILHGCTIGDDVLVGMGAIVMNGATVGDGCVIGAGAVVPAGTEVATGSLVVGMPAVVRRKVASEEVGATRANAENYVRLSQSLSRAVPRRHCND